MTGHQAPGPRPLIPKPRSLARHPGRGPGQVIARQRFAIRGWAAFLLWTTIGLLFGGGLGIVYVWTLFLFAALLFIALIWTRFAPEGLGLAVGFWAGLATLQVLVGSTPAGFISAAIAVAAASWYIRIRLRRGNQHNPHTPTPTELE